MPDFKKWLRIKAQQNRASLSFALRVQAAESLALYLPDLLSFCMQQIDKPAAAIKDFALYYPREQEIDCRPIGAALAASGKKILLPAILKQDKIIFRRFQSGQPLKLGNFGIYEPEAGCSVVPHVILLPLLAYDARGNRLGYGRGYYDKAIADLHKNGYNPPLIGLGFHIQELPVWPPAPHDIALDAVLTEQGLRVFGTERQR